MNAGYLGVDIFFVLSGFLITTGLARSINQTGRINLAEFWSRRFKRLLPAAAIVIVAVLTWANLVVPIYRRANIGTDAWWTVFYGANWRFIASASYFESDGNTSPLMHMWSLAVEEQFYLIWPLLISVFVFLISRILKTTDNIRKVSMLVIIGLAILLIITSAFILHYHFVHGNVNRAYMGTDAKAFEPMLGALAALLLTCEAPRKLARNFARPFIWVGGLTMIALFVKLDGPPPLYYNGGALVFSVATLALIIGIAHKLDGFEARILAFAPISYLGRISYGLYLWHWPFAVWLLDPVKGFEPVRAVIVIILTIVTASLSYHAIEMPIRSGRVSTFLTPRRTLAISLGTMVSLACAVSALGGTPVSRIFSTIFGSNDSTRDSSVMLIVGDSVPKRMVPSLEPVAAEQGLTIVSAARGACTPMALEMNFGPDNDTGDQCPEVRAVQDEMISTYKPGIVLWWSRYEVIDRYDGETLLSPDTEEFWEAQERDFKTTASRFTENGETLIVILTERPGIGMMSRPANVLKMPLIHNMVHEDTYRQRFNSIVSAEAERNPRIITIDGDSLFCAPDDHTGPGALCDDSINGELVRPDGSHINEELFGHLMAERILERIDKALTKIN